MEPEHAILTIEGKSLTINDIVKVARYNHHKTLLIIKLAEESRKTINHIRQSIRNNWLLYFCPKCKNFKSEQPEQVCPNCNKQVIEPQDKIYGFNTGVGALKNEFIAPIDQKVHQKNYIRAHCAGLGNPLDDQYVRAAMLLRANTLAKGFSGVRVEIIDFLLNMLNLGIHPLIPEKGSLGASGDLAPLAHLVSVMVGEEKAKAFFHGKILSAPEALEHLKSALTDKNKYSYLRPLIEIPLVLETKEAIALTNGLSVTLGIGTITSYDSVNLMKNADICMALSLTAIRGEAAAFDPRLHESGQIGQKECAYNIRKLCDIDDKGTVADDKFISEKAREYYHKLITQKSYQPRVQDAYSFRCVPHVHGAARDTIKFVWKILSNHINLVDDNPLILNHNNEMISCSGGNFHGQYLALALDYLGIAMAEIGSISERRIFRLLSHSLSYGLPTNLAGGKPGLNTGLMIAQYTAANLASQNKILAHPASVDSIPTSDNQEDHVSMANIAALKARDILKNVEDIIAIEFISAFQGISLIKNKLSNFQLGTGVQAVYDYLTNHIKPINSDKYLTSEIELLRVQVHNGSIVKEVEKRLDINLFKIES